MIFQYTSVEEVMGRVVRNVGNKLPSHYFDSMLEWIPEGVRMLETKYQLVTKSTGNYNRNEGEPDKNAIITRNHVATLPTDLIELLAVEDKFGNRVRTGSDITDFTNQTNRFASGSENNIYETARPTNFQVDVFDHVGDDPSEGGPAESVPFDGSDLKQQDNPQVRWTYKIQGNMIQTSEECMFIKLHYLSLPMDEKGYLLIPDVEEYKQALTFYILRQLVGAGFNHPIFNGPPGWQQFDNEWEKYAARALGVIKYPTQDRMETLRAGFAERLIPARHFYNDFFIGGESTQEIHVI